MKVWIEVLRRMPASAKINSALAASEMVLRIAEAGVRLQYPQAGEREVFLRAAARHLSRDLMIRAYSWDPELHANPGGRV